MKICLIRHGYYPFDPRVQKEVRALLAAGYAVDVLCLRKAGQPAVEKRAGLRIYRLPLQHKRGSILHYVYEYAASFLMMSTLATGLFLKRRYACLQVNTMPDFLVFTTLLPKLLGAHVVLDLHEPTPELWITKYGRKRLRFLLRLQTRIEQSAIRYADACLTVTETLRRRFVERGADPAKITTVPNVCDDGQFYRVGDSSRRSPGQFTLITHGTIEKRYGHETIIRAVNSLKTVIPRLRFEVLGRDSDYKQYLQTLVKELDCAEQVRFFDYLPFDEMLQKLREADVGVIAMYRTPYSELIDTNKMYEYMALEVPVLISRLPAVEENFGDDRVCYFEPGDYRDLARAILDLYLHPRKRSELVNKAARRYEEMRWSKSQTVYLEVVNAFNPQQQHPHLTTN